MTVKELIDLLKQENPEANVIIQVVTDYEEYSEEIDLIKGNISRGLCGISFDSHRNGSDILIR